MRTIFAMTLLVLALAFAGCEPRNNNSGNAGNNGNGGTPTEPGTTNPTDPANPTEPGTDPTDPTNPGTTADGPWKVEEWQAWVDKSYRRIAGVTSLSAFIDWANTYFPEGIPANPNGGTTKWDSAEWLTYMNGNTAARDAFPKADASATTSINRFIVWAKGKFETRDMPNTPPTDDTIAIVDGPWSLAAWQRWRDEGNSISGITTLTDFINWANRNFPDGIPVNPPGETGEPWGDAAWRAWFSANPGKEIPGSNWSGFMKWANDTYSGEMVPNTPPSAAGSTAPATQSPALETPSTPGNVIGDLIDGLTGSEAATTDRSLEDAGMTEIQP